MADERALKGEAKAPEREAKLAKKRKGKAARAVELERLKGVALVSTFSGLKKLRNDGLSDQLKVWKKMEKKDGAKKTTGTRTELVRALQPLILEKFGEKANDLETGDEGLYCEALKRKKAEPAAGSKRKRKKHMVSWGEWEWDPKAEFVIERLIGRMVADGSEVPGRSNIAAGTVLYKVTSCGTGGQRRSQHGRRRTRFPVGNLTLWRSMMHLWLVPMPTAPQMVTRMVTRAMTRRHDRITDDDRYPLVVQYRSRLAVG